MSSALVHRKPEPQKPFKLIWGFPKIRGTILGVPIIRTIVFGGLYWVPLFWEITILSLFLVLLFAILTIITITTLTTIIITVIITIVIILSTISIIIIILMIIITVVIIVHY